MSRIGTFALGEKTLVMDRENGRWALLPTQLAPLLPLIGRFSGSMPSSVLSAVEILTDKLTAAGIGSAPRKVTGQLTTLIVKITKVCNYRCKYCYDMEPDDELVHLPLDVAWCAIEEALQMVERRSSKGPDLAIILHGGEPTLFFGVIKELVLRTEALAQQLDKKVLFAGQTNASRLTADVVSFSSAHNINWGISCDGPPTENDAFRVLANGSGTYKDFAEALHVFPEFVKDCGILTTVTSNNQKNLLPIARHFQGLGVKSWDWSLFQGIGMARSQCGDFNYSLDAVISGWNCLFEAVESGEFDGFQVKPITDYLHNFILGPGSNMCMRLHCGAARDLLSVSADGSIEACDCIDRKGPLANLGLVQIDMPGSLERARKSPKADLIRSREVTQGACDKCVWLAVCGGTCLAHAESLHGLYESQCRLAMNAFGRIATSISQSDRLKRYWNSLYGAGNTYRPSKLGEKTEDSNGYRALN